MLGTLTSIWNRVFAVLSRFSMYRVAFTSLAALAGVAFILSFFGLVSPEPLELVLTLAVLFLIGVVKSRWTHRSWWSSGLEIVTIGAVAGVAGYFFGSILPIVLGAPEAAVPA